jgi:hypothetical protein
MALIEIDGLPINSTVDLSMANWQCHNQRVNQTLINTQKKKMGEF